MSQLKAKLKAAEDSLAGSDVQALLAMRRNAAEGAALLSEYSLVAMEKASKGMETASENYKKYSKQATEEATRLYAKAVPVVEETQKKCVETLSPHYDAAVAASAPHMATAKEHFKFILGWLKSKLEVGLHEVSVHMPQIKPHVATVSQVTDLTNNRLFWHSEQHD